MLCIVTHSVDFMHWLQTYPSLTFCLKIHLSVHVVNYSSLLLFLSCPSTRPILLSCPVLSVWPPALLLYPHSCLTTPVFCPHSHEPESPAAPALHTWETKKDIVSNRCLFNSCRTANTRSVFAGAYLLLNSSFYLLFYDYLVQGHAQCNYKNIEIQHLFLLA